MSKEYNSSFSFPLRQSHSPLWSSLSALLAQHTLSFPGKSLHILPVPSLMVHLFMSLYLTLFLKECEEAQSHYLMPLWSEFSFWVPRGQRPCHDWVPIYTHQWVSKHRFAPSKEELVQWLSDQAVCIKMQRKCGFLCWSKLQTAEESVPWHFP